MTGAGSALGQALIRRLAADLSAGIAGLVTGRSEPADNTRNVAYLVQDLTETPSPEVAEAMGSADRIVHLAWARPRSASAAGAAADNALMLDRLLAIPQAGPRLVFVSSVSASPRAISQYGQSKYRMQQRVLDAGGSVVVCGLIVSEPPQTAFKTLVDTYRRLPVGFKVLPNTVRVYPVWHDDLIDLVSELVRTPAAPGAYRAFVSNGVLLNDFLVWMMERYSIRKPLLPAPLIAVSAAARLARLAALGGLAEKLNTFFFKDPTVLRNLLDPPGTFLSDTEREFGALARRR